MVQERATVPSAATSTNSDLVKTRLVSASANQDIPLELTASAQSAMLHANSAMVSVLRSVLAAMLAPVSIAESVPAKLVLSMLQEPLSTARNAMLNARPAQVPPRTTALPAQLVRSSSLSTNTPSVSPVTTAVSTALISDTTVPSATVQLH